MYQRQIDQGDLGGQDIYVPQEDRVFSNGEGLDQISQIHLINNVDVDEQLPETVLRDVLDLLRLIPLQGQMFHVGEDLTHQAETVVPIIYRGLQVILSELSLLL